MLKNHLKSLIFATLNEMTKLASFETLSEEMYVKNEIDLND